MDIRINESVWSLNQNDQLELRRDFHTRWDFLSIQQLNVQLRSHPKYHFYIKSILNPILNAM